jgi:hypothetical protein
MWHTAWRIKMIGRFAYSALRTFALALLLTIPAGAVDLGEEEEGGDTAAEEAEPEEGVEQEGEDDGLGEADASKQEGWAKPGEEVLPPKFLIGARYRVMVVPQFLVNAFGVEGGRTVVVHGGGPEFAFSQKDFEIILSPWFAGYSLERTPFKGPNDGENAWEFIESYLSMAYITGDFLWKTHLSKTLDFQIGAGAGVGIVFGNFYRTDAYWTQDGVSMAVPPPNGDPYNTVPAVGNPALAPCVGPGNPADFNVPPTGQCPFGGQYGPASAWPVYPWLTFQTGLRYSPVRNFIGRLDIGIGSSGFWFGLGADYGI